MISTFKRLIGEVTVKEVNDLVYIEGINTDSILNAFYKVWNTSKIGTHMFSRTGGSYIVVHKFFLPDLYYSFSKMLETKKLDINRRAVMKIIDGIKTNTWFRSAFETAAPLFDRTTLNEMKFPLLPHQTEYLDRYEIAKQQYKLNGFLLAAAPGAGKTYMGLFTGEIVKSDVNIFIVPKNSIDLVWKESFETLYKKPTSYWTSSDSKPPVVGRRNYAFHYETLPQAIEFISKTHYQNPLIWVDESHNLNEMTSNRTLLLLDLVKKSKSKNVVWASGTPIKAMGKEVIPLLRCIDPFFDANAERRFTEVFGKSASRATDILANRIGMVTHRTEKKEFRASAPTIKEIKVVMPNGKKYGMENVKRIISEFVKERTKYYKDNKSKYEKQYQTALAMFEKTLVTAKDVETFRLYKSYIQTIITSYDPVVHKEISMFCNNYEMKTISAVLPTTIRDEFRNAKSVVKYVGLKITGEALGRCLGKLREECILSMVRYIKLPEIIDDAEKKTLIFSTYVSAIKEADEYLKEEGYKPMVVYGDTNKDLNGIVNTFGGNEDINPLLATFASLSTAVPLVMANYCVLLNMPFRDHIYTQAISRVDRIGQDTPVTIFKVFLDTGEEGNLSTRAGDILEFCKDQVEQLLGIKATSETVEVMTLESFYNEA